MPINIDIPTIFKNDLQRVNEGRVQYQQSGEVNALREAVNACERILTHPDFPTSEPNFRLASFHMASDCLHSYYSVTGCIEYLDRAIHCSRETLEQYEQITVKAPEYTIWGAFLRMDLGKSLVERYKLTGKTEDLDHAIHLYEQAIPQAPQNTRLSAEIAIELVSALRHRYEWTGETENLNRAIDLFQRYVKLTSPNAPERPRYANNLGTLLLTRYWRMGMIDDLESGIQAFENAAALSDSSDLALYLSNLGAGLTTRYMRTKDLADLKRAIAVLERATHSQADSALHNVILVNLGTGLMEFYERTGESDNLNKAIKAYEQAIERTPIGCPDLPNHLNMLGIGLHKRYECTGVIDDLQRAIHIFEQAQVQAPVASSLNLEIINNLAAALLERYDQMGMSDDLDRAIRFLESALDQVPSGSPWHAEILHNLGVGLTKRYDRNGALSVLERAINCLERARSILETMFFGLSVPYKLGQQRNWFRLYLFLVVAYLKLAEADQSQESIARLHALEVAESSKSRILIELLGRGDLNTPPTVSTQQVALEKELVSALSVLDAGQMITYLGPATAEWKPGRIEGHKQHETYLFQLQKLWEEMARTGPEAAEYVALRRGSALTSNELVDLVRSLEPPAALVSLFIMADKTLLFVLTKNHTAPVVIKADFGATEWHEVIASLQQEIHDYSKSTSHSETWHKRLLTPLEKVNSHLAEVERVFISPEGLGHLIPWPVLAWRAGWQSRAGSPLPVISVPTFSLLPLLQSRVPTGDSPPLVVGDPIGNLGHARAEAQEVAEVLGTAPLIGRDANKALVLERLANCSVAHLSTHAYFDRESPLNSGIVLADGVLTAREVMNHRLRVDLLVLSACETGITQVIGGTELAGLGHTFLQVGSRSLLISLWKVSDPSTAALMTAFHKSRGEGLNNIHAFYQAMANVRSSARWAHPYYWGAFVLMGYW